MRTFSFRAMQQVLADLARQNWAETAKQAVAVISALIALLGVLGGAMGNLGGSSNGGPGGILQNVPGGGKVISAPAGATSLSSLSEDPTPNDFTVSEATLKGNVYPASLVAHDRYPWNIATETFVLKKKYATLKFVAGNNEAGANSRVRTTITVTRDSRPAESVSVVGNNIHNATFNVKGVNKVRVQVTYTDSVTGERLGGKGGTLGNAVLLKK